MLQVIAAPAVPLFDTTDAALAACLHLEAEEIAAEAAFITGLIAAASAHVGHLGRLALIDTSYRRTLVAFTSAITFPVGRVRSVSQVRYRDTSGDLVTLDAGAYRLASHAGNRRLVPVHGVVWPQVSASDPEIIVDFVAGFGPAPADVPGDLVQAVRLLVAHWFLNREAATPGAQMPLPFGVEALVAPHRSWA